MPTRKMPGRRHHMARNWVIYEPAGRAAEYAELACNIFNGCSHGCLYCFAPGCLRRERADFHAAVTVKQRLETNLYRDCQDLMGDERLVQLCFTTDPYQPGFPGVTRGVIQTMKRHGLRVQILTKAGADAQADLDLLGATDSFGVSLTLMEPLDSLMWEPHAALPQHRIANLRAAVQAGVPTWASCEPVIYPEQTLALIRASASAVGLFRVGTMNHIKESNISETEKARLHKIDWAEFGSDVIGLLEALGKPYYIKSDLYHKLWPGAKNVLRHSLLGRHGE